MGMTDGPRTRDLTTGRTSIARRLVETAGALALMAISPLIRRRHLRWGATDAEVAATMPGDELLDRAQFTATRAVTIAAAPATVWPWLVQVGFRRAGFYSYDLLDSLGRPSSDTLLDQWQHPGVGDIAAPMAEPATPTTAFTVAGIEPPRRLVWSKPDSTWAWRLDPTGDGRTRLVTRLKVRYRLRPDALFTVPLIEFGDFAMMRRMLQGIRARAERSAERSAVRSTDPATAAGHTADTAIRRGSRLARVAVAGVIALSATEAMLIHLGRTYGATARERSMPLAGDDIIDRPRVTTTHAVTIDAPPSAVWPWLVQMGWHRGGWYTARWVDRLLFPANWPSATRIIADLQHIEVGDFIPDGPPETECGLVVEGLDPERSLVLHSTSHLPKRWRDRGTARLDWSWAFVLLPVDDGRRTRFVFRSRWTTAPWWLTLAGWLAVVPADFVMSRDMLHGVRQRAESTNLPGAS